VTLAGRNILSILQLFVALSRSAEGISLTTDQKNAKNIRSYEPALLLKPNFPFIVVPCVSMSLICSPINACFIKFEKDLKFTLELKLSLLLHVSICGRHQGASATLYHKLVTTAADRNMW